MAVNWTKNQQRIIDFNDGNLLVAAGAGSGKTAVLTAHIVKRITDQERGVDLDTLLVVTFTNAAAAEMKERVRKNLEQKLEENPADENLSRQIGLIPSANISTIHSFCLKLIREQFFRLDLDPGFRLGDTGELSLMKADLLEEIFEEAYENRDEAFLELRDMYGGKESDDRVTELILKLYEYAQSYPNPDEWLEKSLGDDDGWVTGLNDTLKMRLADLAKRQGDAVKLAVNDHIPPSMIGVLQDDESGLKLLTKKETLGELCVGISEFKFGTKPRLNKKEKAEYASALDSADKAFEIRDEVKDGITKLKKAYAGFGDEQVKRQQKETADLRAELVKLVRIFSGRFSEKKRSLGICDFSDLEHMALNILYEDGQPSDVADSYAMSFNEILVDEYQDCNLVQESILYAVSRDRFGKENRFMVGDVKQSIYGFRQARPDIFLDKYKSYSDAEDAHLQKIELSDNFRSRSGVLGGINMLFAQIMTEGLGGIAYDEKAALRAGGSFPEKADVPDMQLLLLDLSDPEDGENTENKCASYEGETEDYEAVDTSGYNKFEHEARMVASKIIELVNPKNPYMVFDRDLGQMRPADFKDIVILMRSLSSTQENYVRILKEMGVPVYVENESGYFSSIEVVDVLNYLRVLDNPLQDIPLAGVMRSAFGGFSAEEMAKIRLTGVGKGEDKTYYACLLAARESDPKVDRFLTGIEGYRRLSRFVSIRELLTRILEETGYRYYVAALPGGKKRLVNLDMLIAKAKSYEETSYRGLFHFIRYIDRLKKYNYEMDIAGGGEDEINAVRIMTIHKSKGLEFPIVFISNMNGGFNEMDLNAPILLDSEYGIASDIRNAKYRYKAKSIKRAAIRERKHLSLLEEEMRVLYVAMTRAKELLIMTGASKEMEDKLEDFRETAKGLTGQLSFSVLSSASNYLDWVVPAYLYAQSLKPENVKLYMRTFKKGELDFVKVYVPETGSNEYDDLPDKLSEILSWTYPNEELANVHAAMSVSEIKKAAYESEEIVNIVRNEQYNGDKDEDKAKNGDGVSSGTDRGTAYHRALELYRFGDYPVDGTCEEKSTFVTDEMTRITQSHLISEADAEMINVKDLETFFETRLAARMCAAEKKGRLYKEKPFMMGVPVGQIYKEMRGRQESVLIRGIIDAYFEEDDGLIIVDYKTDRVYGKAGEETLKKRYAVQVEYYKRALEAATIKKVKQVYLYSFALKKEIEILC